MTSDQETPIFYRRREKLKIFRTNKDVAYLCSYNSYCGNFFDGGAITLTYQQTSTVVDRYSL